ncbi:flavin-containing monooxygenase FMO GS-OX-like 8 [Miscanthus floridulus]|uniref:flavin-containing monooxygenase FMO GS-OX-like 8 n=1 Tax=Miscanthus floridulus TaxID=154761 RepID=UPI003458196A
MVSSKKVCMIGAGVSGLASARELLREGHDVTVMEQSSGVGGQWLYDPRTDGGGPLGAAGAHSSMYASVRLISPRELTCFSDFPFFPSNDGTGDARRYPGHAEFLRYIRDFCDAFGLMDVVRLNTKVLHVGLAPPLAADDGVKRWTVRWSRRGDCEGDAVTTEEVFDAVVVAVGQYTQPRLPTISGMNKWSRRQLHSHSYRVPDSFDGEVVVIVGFHESGKDIAQELSGVAREVHVSVKSMEVLTPAVSKAVGRHHNLHLHLQIECLCEDGQVTFADGSRVVADSIIYCTGYDFWFPFLDTGGLLTVDDNRVGPLFEHTFPPALAPSLSFVGVPRLVLVPRFYEAQARWVAQVLSGRRPLPPEEEMLRSAEEYHRAREAAGVPRRLSHTVFFDMDYCDEFGAKHCGFPPLEGWKRDLLSSSVARVRDGDVESYRDSDLVLEGLRSDGW